MNIDLKTSKIKNNVFTAYPSKRCCVLETFIINNLGFERKDFQKWIANLSDTELKNKVIRLEGAVLEDFIAEYLTGHSIANADSLCMLTSEGIRSLFEYYLKTYKYKLTKSEKKQIDELSQRFTTVFYEIRNSRITRIGFWEYTVKDAINIPDMSKNININNSSNVIVTAGDHNENFKVNGNNNDTRNSPKPKWLKCLSWIFIFGCLLWAFCSLYFQYSITNNYDDIKFGWQEIVQTGGLIIGLIINLY